MIKMTEQSSRMIFPRVDGTQLVLIKDPNDPYKYTIESLDGESSTWTEYFEKLMSR